MRYKKSLLALSLRLKQENTPQLIEFEEEWVQFFIEITMLLLPRQYWVCVVDLGDFSDTKCSTIKRGTSWLFELFGLATKIRSLSIWAGNHWMFSYRCPSLLPQSQIKKIFFGFFLPLFGLLNSTRSRRGSPERSLPSSSISIPWWVLIRLMAADAPSVE